jgi:hypothetical protein
MELTTLTSKWGYVVEREIGDKKPKEDAQQVFPGRKYLWKAPHFGRVLYDKNSFLLILIP